MQIPSLLNRARAKLDDQRRAQPLVRQQRFAGCASRTRPRISKPIRGLVHRIRLDRRLASTRAGWRHHCAAHPRPRMPSPAQQPRCMARASSAHSIVG